jgi:acetyltransferase-like isoleucine patch superfamily enzyme
LIRHFKHLLRLIVEKLSRTALDWRLVWTYRHRGLEGVNRILTQCDSADVGHILMRFGADLGKDHDLNSPLLIHNAVKTYSNLAIGHECHLGKDVFLDLRDNIIIEDQVTISMRVTILTHTDVGHSPLGKSTYPPQHAPAIIKRGAYIGAGAIIVQGVTIGVCAVVGSGAIVVDDVPDYSVAVGVPARVVRSLAVGREEG